MYTIAHRMNAFALACWLAAVQSAFSQEDVAETKTAASIDTTPIVEPLISAQDRAHWAFRPIVRPPLPPTQNPASQIPNPIDRFILAKLNAKNLKPTPQAVRPTL